jgi:hypothetical protein
MHPATTILALATLTAIALPATAEPKPATTIARDFRKLEFGMFIHYNMATYKQTPVGRGLPQIRPTSTPAARSTPTPGRTPPRRRA